MKYRSLDSDGDYVLGYRKNIFLFGREAVGQAIKTRLKLLLEEWWENTEDGLPLFQQILGTFGGEDNLNGVDLIIQERILSTQDVIGLKDFQRNFNFKTREYTFSAIVETRYGEFEIKSEEVM
ncbi:hypothetical protein [uncultured Tissierella sp.]|uniref:hypothetical protein n=1 Tax=uncultured Tissierella sp. TaxID=448160 RepID=UPI0028059A97|nr:hypothetical protein [uncultured Tissierella sp.]MDU5080223.1 hypothetical protein [Bacillota bacterium]